MALAASAPIGLFVATERDGVVLVNDCFEEITGRREEELLGDGWIATIHPDDRSRVIEETARLQSDTSVEHRVLKGFFFAPPQPAADLTARLMRPQPWV
jgi:PAS domain S-box-containing protein